ncbi:3-oxoacyl-[acyl-carrier-protein] reductase FabG (plasmid) [Cupriavidus necator N-1]|uniref:3-oxoacyl-[acyl-carrier-protein] reductase FabG n=1 Tax=Cupriavidus necator (strain ATCC 43291 / DSM 13513 / CCUG 52238 / LMG 8453 / N-1) TaxID=1042878 RepID=F8GXD4_CUPNN|nr:SDR family oxidoreductase [Cupriavidus necator]AEI82004.1 3-oxoacyl-[acyl-carrier-protein] reductase FabG [Cupriavidus necator N-1]MDX6008322.1 SDR family oxidoreductase [Cupriavidus necator]
MDLGIKGKTALITASSGGMGRNIAHALAAEGVNVVLFARSADKLQAVADEIEQQHGVKAVAVPGNMLVRADVERLASSLRQNDGGPDIVVLNTSRPPNPIRATLEETDEERWKEAYQNQLWGTIQVVTHVIPLMLDRNWGRVIAITSASVKQPMPHHSLSTVFRAGVTAYMKHLANEVGASGITVNCVAPALIDTSHRSGGAAYSAEQTAARKKLTPLGRLGTQQETTGVVTFLASMQAGFVNGATIPVEGGMVGSLL